MFYLRFEGERTMFYQRFEGENTIRVDSRICREGANSPPVFPKGGQPGNQMGNGVFLKINADQPITP